jgi:peptidyl-prolyl cis-trans isomerase C
MQMGRANFYFFGLAFLFALPSCQRFLSRNNGNIPVMVVNGDAYLATAFSQDLAKKLKAFDALAAKDPINVRRSKESALREFAISALLSQYAKAHQITVSQAEVDAAFDQVRSGYPDDLTFKAALAADGQALEEWKTSLKKTLIQKKVFASLDKNFEKGNEGTIEEKAKAYYTVHKAEFDRPAQIHLEQILVAKEDDAERLYHKLKSGASFSEVAKKFSISPEGAHGGDLGYISRGVVPIFDKAFDLTVGQISVVTKSNYGFHIMKVLDKRAAGVVPYERAKKGIMRKFEAQTEQEAFSQWLDGAIKTSKTERNDNLIEKIRVRTEGEQE